MTPSRFAELRVQQISAGMGARAPRRKPTLPEAYRAPRQVRRGLQTCRLLVIGSAYTPPPPAMSQDAELAQAALLEPRTARPLSVPARIFGAVWRWL